MPAPPSAIHVTGASGSGTTTLGPALSAELSYRHVDADDHYWLKTDPPYRQSHSVECRSGTLMAEMIEPFVQSGSIVGWAPDLASRFDLVVFLWVPAEVRVERLRQREVDAYGLVDEAFLEWAATYDSGPSFGRSLAKHEAWLAECSCPVVRIVGDITVDKAVAKVLRQLR